MAGRYESIREQLGALSSLIVSGRPGWASRAWGGADVVIVDRPSGQQPEVGFYPDPRHVVTRFVLELSWLFENLRDTFGSTLDSATKIEFYGRLANAANRYLARTPGVSQTLTDLLLSVLHEAFVMSEEMEDGRFQHLLIASGNTIWDDFVDEAERSGYLGPDETRRFFEEMERRHRDA